MIDHQRLVIGDHVVDCPGRGDHVRIGGQRRFRVKLGIVVNQFSNTFGGHIFDCGCRRGGDGVIVVAIVNDDIHADHVRQSNRNGETTGDRSVIDIFGEFVRLRRVVRLAIEISIETTVIFRSILPPEEEFRQRTGRVGG